MGAGSYGLFDGQALTGPSEYDSRYGTPVDTLQIHHATMTSLPGLVALMQPGGRQVSANGAMGNDGTLLEVVPATMRAFTSASTYDRRCITVECCNTTLAPYWGISDATHRRLGKLAADMYQAGLLGGVDRRFIIGHNEVPGSYPTACPGPSMNLDLVVQYAHDYLTPTPDPVFGEDEMALLDGGYIAEVKDSKYVRGMIFGPGVPGGVIVKDASNIVELQAMGNLAGVRVFNPEDGTGKRVGAPIKNVGTAEFDATAKLAAQIFGTL